MALGVDSALTTIAACGVVGAFIDFWIGRQGEKRVRDWMETWWLRLSYVKWGNLGREEALFAVQVIDYLFGRKLFSRRRMVVAAAITITFGALVLAANISTSSSAIWYSFTNLGLAFYFAIEWISVGASLSVSRFVAVGVARIVTKVPLLNLLGLMFIISFQIILLYYYPMFASAFHDIFIYAIMGQFSDIIDQSQIDGFIHDIKHIMDLGPIQSLAAGLVSSINNYGEVIDAERYSQNTSFLLSFVVSFGRLLVAAIFISSFLLKPIQGPLMGLFARVIESDKHIFTLLFGGTAVAAKAVEWALHTL